MAKILFIQEDCWQKLGIMYLSGTLKKHGHEVELVIASDITGVVPLAESFLPDVLGFSIMTGDHQWAADLAWQLKKKYPGVTTLFGGPHCTFFPDFIHEEGVDALVRGEGELACLEFMNCIDGKMEFNQVKSLCYKENSQKVENEMGSLDAIDDIEFPDRTLYNNYLNKVDFSVVYMLTTRGCPYKCTFCFEEEQQKLYKGLGAYVRVRGIENILREIKEAVASGFCFDHIMFIDDVFGVDRKWLYKFLVEYKKEINLPFICILRADLVFKGDDYAQRLADAGCVSASFGIESGNEGLRQLSLQKQLTDEQIIVAAEELHKAGIKFKTYNLFGFPGETIEHAFSTVDINIRIKTDFPQSNLFIPFPKTGLAEYAMDNGYLRKDFDVDDIRNDTFIHSALESPYRKELERINKFFQTAVLFPAFWPLIKRYCIAKVESPLLDRLCDLWFSFVYFLVYWKSSKRNTLRLVVYGLKNLRKFIGLVPLPAQGDSRKRGRKKRVGVNEPETEKNARRKRWLAKVEAADSVRLHLVDNKKKQAELTESVKL